MSKQIENFRTDLTLALDSINNGIELRENSDDAKALQHAQTLRTMQRNYRGFEKASDSEIQYIASACDVSEIPTQVKAQKRMLDVTQLILGTGTNRRAIARAVASVLTDSVQTQRAVQDSKACVSLYPDQGTRHAYVRNVLLALKALRVIDDNHAIRSTQRASDAIAALRG